MILPLKGLSNIPWFSHIISMPGRPQVSHTSSLVAASVSAATARPSISHRAKSSQSTKSSQPKMNAQGIHGLGSARLLQKSPVFSNLFVNYLIRYANISEV